MCDHGSIGPFFGNSVFGGKFGFECFGVFLFCFRLVRGKKSSTHRILVGNQRERTTSSCGFLSFLVYLWQFCIVQIMSGPKTFLYICFVFFRPLIGNFLSFFLFAFFQSLIENFLLLLSSGIWSGTFFFFRFSSSEGKDRHSSSRFMVSWDFGSRLVERLDMIYVRVLVWPAVQG